MRWLTLSVAAIVAAFCHLVQAAVNIDPTTCHEGDRAWSPCASLILGNGLTQGFRFLGLCLAVFAVGVIALIIAFVSWIIRTSHGLDKFLSFIACLAFVFLTIVYLVELGEMLRDDSLFYFLLAGCPALLALTISVVRRFDLD